jgi:DNA-binding Lrp family transcriptional regulator
VGAGRAWVSSAVGPALPVAGGLMEVECEPGAALAVADRLSVFPHVFSVHVTTGRMNVYALVVAADERKLAGLLVEVLPATPGIRSVQTATVFQLFSGTYWRLGAISSSQARDVAPPVGHAVPHRFDDFDRMLYLAMQEDGRLSYRDLGAILGCSEVAARRRLQLLSRSGMIAFRTDFARAEGGWSTNVVLTLSVDADTAVAEVGRVLVNWPETRVCAATLGGSAQLFVTIQLHHPGGLDDFSARLHQTFPGVEVLDRRVALRPIKSYGRLLDSHGCAHGLIPVDPWADISLA